MPLEGKRRKPIGIFDSGVGGLTVMRQVREALPYESLTYLGDTARLPYGNKSRDAVVRFSLENARYLVEQDIKALVVACNTATAYALEALKQVLPLPVIGVINPGVAAAVKVTKSGHIAVLGTRGTILSGAYQSAITELHPEVIVHPIACPLFVPLVEENCLDHAVTRLIVREYLQPLKTTLVDTVILGCTHYPLLRDLIQEELGSQVTIIDSARACAVALRQALACSDLLATTPSPTKNQFFVSDDPEGFQRVGGAILGDGLDRVQLLLL